MSLTDVKYVVVGDKMLSPPMETDAAQENRPAEDTHTDGVVGQVAGLAGDAPHPVGNDMAVDASTLPTTGISAALLSGYVGNFYRVVEGLTSVLKDVDLALPQIVVVGQESSGKSSVLESLAMMPLFPRKEDICTWLPIHLKMRYTPQRDGSGGMRSGESTTHQIKMKIIYSDGRAPVTSDEHMTSAQAAQLITEWMEKIVMEEDKEKKLQGVVDHVLEIEVCSPHVPNLNLIDLPGIVAGRLMDEPDDMMQRTRALVEKYLRMPHTLVLAVVPASERVRNSQAFQLVQQYNLTDSTIGVLTMVDRSLDMSNPQGPLAEVMSRLDGTSRDIVYLKEGYVAVRNRDTRAKPELSLEESKDKENAWLEENLPGYMARSLASSSVLATKLEKMLADHKLGKLGPGADQIVDNFRNEASETAARQQMLELLRPILPRLLERIDEEMLHLVMLIHADFLESREEHALMSAPFATKSPQDGAAGTGSASLMTASLLILGSHRAYLANNLGRILKNAVLRIANLIEKLIATPTKPQGATSQLLERFIHLHFFFAGVLWDQMNKLLVDQDGLVRCLETSFLEFDPESTTTIRVPKLSKQRCQQNYCLQEFADTLRMYLASNGFQNASIDALDRPATAPAPSLYSNARAIIAAKAPRLPRELTRNSSIPSAAHLQSLNPTPKPAEDLNPTMIDAKVIIAYNGDFKPDKEIPTEEENNSDSADNFITFIRSRRKRNAAKVQRGSDSLNPVPPSSAAKVPPPAVINSNTNKMEALTAEPDTAAQDDLVERVGEFEARLFFAITSHVVAPLLQSICTVGGLTQKMRKYVENQTTLSASEMYLFRESTAQERKKLTELVKCLDVARDRLESTSHFE